jgi:hypothetical protein
MRWRRWPFILALLLALHFAMLVLFGRLGLPSLEAVYWFGLLLPELFWSVPWYGILGKLGLMEGEGAVMRIPSLAGLALVNAVYFIGFIGLGVALIKKP